MTTRPNQAAPRVLPLALAAAFPLLVWWCASFYFLGDTGKYSDDWSINYRAFGSQGFALDGHPFERWNYFWRPLHLVLTCGGQTLFWEMGWVLHALNALAHGAVAWLVWRFAREIGVGPRCAAASALLVLVHPAVYEVVNWTSTISTAIATAALIGLWRRTAAWATNARSWHGWRSVWWLGPAVFGIACFYEQQAGAACLLPLLYWTLGELDPDRPRREVRLQRAAMIGVGPAAACVLYVVLMVSTAPRHLRGGEGSFGTLGEIAVRFRDGLRTCSEWLWGERAWSFARGGLEQGGAALTDVGPFQGWAPGVYGGVLMGLLIVAASVWFAGWWRVHASEEPSEPADRRVRYGLVAIGMIVFTSLSIAISLLPSAAATKVLPQPRLMYFPVVCLAVALGAVITAVVRAMGASRSEAVAHRLGPVLVVGVLLGCVVHVGAQEAFRRRSRADFDLLAQLRALMPDPPEGATFVPVSLQHRPVRTSSVRFNTAAPSAANLPWAAWAWVRQGYQRRDLLSTNFRPALASPFAAVDGKGFRYVSRWGGARGAVPAGGWRVRWDESIPFVVDASGKARLVRTIEFAGVPGRDNEPTLRIEIPIVVKAIEGGRLDADRVVDHTVGPARR